MFKLSHLNISHTAEEDPKVNETLCILWFNKQLIVNFKLLNVIFNPVIEYNCF